MSTTPESDPPPPVPVVSDDPYAALRIPSYRRYIVGSFICLLGMQMQGVAVGWEIYERTHSYLELGLIGLVQILPVLVFGIFAGQLADIFPRLRILRWCLIGLTTGSLAMTWISWTHGSITALYCALFVNSLAKAFQQPARGAMLPLLVPRECFANAIKWNGMTFQLACVLGPTLAGIILATTRNAAYVYLLEGTGAFVFWNLLVFVKPRPQQLARTTISWRDIAGGARFIWNTQLVLAAISLDLFAVLLGGATALLPVYAKDILHVGETGLGWMRAMPALGAISMSIALAHLPPLKRAGPTLLWSVAGFGVATIVFGYSRSFLLSMVMLFLTGGLDMVSVVVRHTLIQLLTPDEMRGRVAAINGIFIGASNELGGFESGTVAHWFRSEQDPSFGPTISVASGGVGTLIIVAATAWLMPQLRKLQRLDDLRQENE